MKITPAHYAELKAKIDKVLSGEQVNPKLAHRPIPELDEYLKAGMSAKRYRWDLLYYGGLSNWIGQALYPYLNDDHIDTAMRKITAS